jgi:prefoldin subunit 5
MPKWGHVNREELEEQHERLDAEYQHLSQQYRDLWEEHRECQASKEALIALIEQALQYYQGPDYIKARMSRAIR